MIAQLREALTDLRSDHEALCALLIKEGMISVQGLSQQTQLQRIEATRRACPLSHVFDLCGIALVTTRFMTRSDYTIFSTTSKHLSQIMSTTSSAVNPFKILLAHPSGLTELFDTTSGRWETLPNMREPRSFPMSAVIRGCLYVCGGWNRRNVTPSSSVESFDPLQNRWRSLRPMSVPRVGAASAVVGHHMYVIGGMTVGGRLLNTVGRLNTTSEVWEAQPAMVQSRDDPGAAAIRERIYAVGGTVDNRRTRTRTAERFGGAWTTLPPMTHRRSQCSTAVIANKLYACGCEDGTAPNTVERFDPAHDTWALLRPTLHHRVGATVAVLRDRLYLLGGRSDDRRSLDAVESYDPDTDSWDGSAPMSHARFDAKAATVNGCLYVFGGEAGSAQRTLSALRSVERFDPVTGRWEALPDMTVTAGLVAAIDA